MLDRLSRETVIGAAVAVGIAVLLIATGLSSSLVLGLVNGAVYGLMALGLVLVYKSSGIFNFAQGEFGTVAVYVLWLLLERGVPYILAIVLALGTAAAFGVLVERVVIRPLFDAPRVILLVATAGVFLLALSIQVWFGGFLIRQMRPLAPRLDRLSILGVNVSDQRMLLIVVLVGLGIGLAYFFNRTTLGLAVISASQEPTATELVGISVKRVSALIWGLAAFFGGVVGVLNAPIDGSFSPAFLTRTALIPGFTAAVLGGMTSLPGAFVGGAIVGVAQNVALSAGIFSSIPGPDAVMVFTILVVVLVIRPQGLLGKAA